MLVEIAIGDAYGAGFEFLAPAPGRENDLSRYLPHPLHPMPPGSYTDDTQMSVAVAEAMLETDGRLTPLALADAFVRAFHRDPRLGYARRFREFLLTVRTGEEFIARMNPASERSGAAMRAGPIGLYALRADVLAMAELQARLTHDTPRGVEAAQAAALCVHYCRFYPRGSKAGLPAYLAEALGAFWLDPHEGEVDEIGVNVVRAAVTVLVRSRSQSDVLRNAVAFTGDVDSVAAIAMAAASVSPDIAPDLPGVLLRGLEDGPYGRRWLQALNDRLIGSCTGMVASGAGRGVT